MVPRYVPPFRRGPEPKHWAISHYASDPFHPEAWNRLSREDNQIRALQRFQHISKQQGLEVIPFAINPDAPCREHLVLLKSPTSPSRIVMVQALRRVHHADSDNGQDSYTYIEISRESLQPLGPPRNGWLYACPSDEVAIELRNGFLIVPRVGLEALVQQIKDANAGFPPIRHFRNPKQIYRRLFSRDDPVTGLPSGALLTLVSIRHDLLPLAGTRLLQLSKDLLSFSTQQQPWPQQH